MTSSTPPDVSKPLTVGELIEELKNRDPNMLVKQYIQFPNENSCFGEFYTDKVSMLIGGYYEGKEVLLLTNW